MGICVDAIPIRGRHIATVWSGEAQSRVDDEARKLQIEHSSSGCSLCRWSLDLQLSIELPVPSLHTR